MGPRSLSVMPRLPRGRPGGSSSDRGRRRRPCAARGRCARRIGVRAAVAVGNTGATPAAAVAGRIGVGASVVVRDARATAPPAAAAARRISVSAGVVVGDPGATPAAAAAAGRIVGVAVADSGPSPTAAARGIVRVAVGYTGAAAPPATAGRIGIGANRCRCSPARRPPSASTPRPRRRWRQRRPPTSAPRGDPVQRSIRCRRRAMWASRVSSIFGCRRSWAPRHRCPQSPHPHRAAPVSVPCRDRVDRSDRCH